ncbi:uncharacterized protein LOC127281463 [Leptopilina boulardi]|uniref:uncharacterized protein LOC127281463 n=1 Tax=Leptopilina boulardi TaxID=63433 RepID=UPI0021F5FEFB|nr:uncharacterized protein LOC127281463 [Leptopilina boulardi]
MEHFSFATTINVPTSQLITSAVINVYDRNKQLKIGRALLDTCATANFITENFLDKLNLPKQKCSIPIGALNDLSTVTKHIVKLTIRSRYNAFEKTITCLSVPEISRSVPNEFLKRELFNIPSNLPLADPNFNKPAAIDLLLGSGPTLSMLCVGQNDLSKNGEDLCIQKTRVGWIIGGTPNSNLKLLKTKSKKLKLDCHLIELRESLVRFWEIEEGQVSRHFSAEELECEKHFQEHVSRDQSGKYVVALPFKKAEVNVGESYQKALKRFKSLLFKFHKNPDLKTQYTEVIDEYISLNHMTKVNEVDKTDGFYLPHLAVIKETSLSTKLRVVFDASAKTNNGLSLNDELMVGPTIQQDIISLLLKFRIHKYVITADVEKMYRQILVRKEDRKYQRLLWGTENSVDTYELNTVTFGLACAPFLAIRCLQQLAEDEGERFPTTANILKNDVYVDNLLSGSDTIEGAIKIREEMITLLKLAGFNLRQWGSNDPRILHGLPESSIIPNFQLDKDQPVKTLGVFWNAKKDSITFTAHPINLSVVKTKRTILSEIAKFFDPLGLVGPIVLYAKIIIQKIWQSKLEWDESVTSSIFTSWSEFCDQLLLVNNLSFDRKIILDDATNVQMHGFCDASEAGYGACIYIRSTDSSNRTIAKLFYAKSKVAPIKTVSLPRLELCGALLLARLARQVTSIIKVDFEKTVFWTDSTIALSWIQTSPHLLKTFVANRVADIHRVSNSNQWRHIRSNDNPADALSRGQLPRDFLNNSQWINGPSWLILNESHWPILQPNQLGEIPERKKATCLTITRLDSNFLQSFSSYDKLIRIVAYCLRFKHQKLYKGLLKVEELAAAEKTIIKLIQSREFSKDIINLKQGNDVNKKSKLLLLNPFIDNEGILRVGGRLNNSSLPSYQKQPILLPRSHHITTLIVNKLHLNNFHSGCQSTLYALRRKFWIPDGRNQVRKIIRTCVRCFRANPNITEYKMGNLPSVRLTKARPFQNVGVDYCGHFYIKEKKFRNRGRIKVYVAVFVCLVVKAIHLEVVSDLTTEGFLGALKRFVARRGKPSNIYSDNGKNFIGANNELKDLFALLNSENHKIQCVNFANKRKIKWHFIPPLSPHFGGIWESAVKSFKHHLKRVITDQLLTFEEINTLVIEIEAVLNSRPLTPISSDPNDLLVLTPGHFLIGDALTSLPEEDFQDTPTNKLSTWQHLQKLRQHFWGRWSKEYLNNLNTRVKWADGNHQIKEGTVVVIKEDNLPPMQWALGRVTETHPGEDGIIRVVTTLMTPKNHHYLPD